MQLDRFPAEAMRSGDRGSPRFPEDVMRSGDRGPPRFPEEAMRSRALPSRRAGAPASMASSRMLVEMVAVRSPC